MQLNGEAMKYTGKDEQLLQLLKMGLITSPIACEVQADMDKTGKDALYTIWKNGLKRAINMGSILDHYSAFMNSATEVLFEPREDA